MRDSIRTNSVKLDFRTRDVERIINNIHISEPAKKRKKPKSKPDSGDSIPVQTDGGGGGGEGGSGNMFESLYQFPTQIPFGQIRGTNPLADIESQNLRRIGDEERQKIQQLGYIPRFNQPMRQITQGETGNRPFRESVMVEFPEEDTPNVVVPSQIQEFTNTTTDLSPEQERIETVLPPEPGQVFETPVPPAFESEEQPSRMQPQQKIARDIPSLFRQQELRTRVQPQPEPQPQPQPEPQPQPQPQKRIKFELNPDIDEYIRDILIGNMSMKRSSPEYITKSQILSNVQQVFNVSRINAENHYKYAIQKYKE